MKTFVRLWQSIAESFLQSEVFRTKFVEKNQNTYFIFSMKTTK
jgi:hypothetical protein